MQIRARADVNGSAQMALVLSRVYARFADAQRKEGEALKDVTFSIAAGEFVSFAGPSGAGKSTLMRVILGLMPIESGVIVRNFAKPAMVFQNYALFPWLTALENVAFGLHMAGMSRRERDRVAREKLAEVGLAGFEGHLPVTLSGGQRQRVGLARALAISPDLLIMDEPFSNLDSITADALKADLLKIWRAYGMTVLMVNHLIPDAVELSDQVIVMGAHPGHIEKIVPIELTRPRDVRMPHFFKAVDALTEVIRSVA
ncbi:MAG TPA: ABC transporter ATP-binding protein [Candidatus Paceibacterota bacterium]|nr:ABC transporter ATP-binding protein [Candidatus Paceibacterota bacterium]